MSDVVIGASLRSILVQVAFKAAVDLKVADKDQGVSLTDSTEALYGLLIEAHQRHDAGDDPNDIRYARRGGGGGGGGRRGGGGGGQSQAKVPSEAKSKIMLDFFGNGTPVAFYDNRPFKQGAANPHPQYGGQYSERSADFQSVDEIDGKRQGLWLTAPNGEPNDDVVAMVQKASGSAANTAPFV